MKRAVPKGKTRPICSFLKGADDEDQIKGASGRARPVTEPVFAAVISTTDVGLGLAGRKQIRVR
jgi:hypothetical protein